jgi:NACalpha-BTF3-like transcription factor
LTPEQDKEARDFFASVDDDIRNGVLLDQGCLIDKGSSHQEKYEDFAIDQATFAAMVSGEEVNIPEVNTPIKSSNQEKCEDIKPILYELDEKEFRKICQDKNLKVDIDEVRCVMTHAQCSMYDAMEAMEKWGNCIDAILELTP